MNLNKIFLASAALFFLLTSCSKSEPDKAVNGKEVKFNITQRAGQFDTKLGKETFAIGDCIGIYAVKRTSAGSVALPKEGTNQANNAKWTKTENGWIPSSPTDKVVWPQDGTAMDFYAYYPYDENASNPESVSFSINKQQNEEDNFNASDILYATNTTGMTEGMVNLIFDHLFPMVKVNLAEVEASDYTVSSANIVTDVTVNIGTKEVTETGRGLVSYLLKDGSFMVIMPVQTIESGFAFIQCNKGDASFIYKTTEALSLESGVIQPINLSLK